MEFEDVVKENVSGVWGHGGGTSGYEVDHFGEGVHEDNNGIKASLGDRELGDEVHGDLFPGSAQDGKGLEEACRDLLTCLDPLAGITGLYIMADIIIHAGPIEERMNSGICSFDALVTSDGGVMMVVEDLCTEGALGDAEMVLVIAKGTIEAKTVVFQERGRDSF